MDRRSGRKYQLKKSFMKLSLNLLIILLLSSECIYSQQVFRVVFYNVENFFDNIDNPEKDDNEFTPEGKRYWNNKRYYTKINNISKVITSIGEWSYPAIVGLCEVENEKVLNDLTKYSPLKNAGYRYIITHSPDVRGINTALLYQRDQFKYLSHDCISISFPVRTSKKTRDILHVTGQLITGDTLDVFICHYPSRRGGKKSSEPDRCLVSSILKHKTDSLFRIRRNANLILMGDFNDEPSDKSIKYVLEAKPIKKNTLCDELYNLFLVLEKKSPIGSYKFRSQWNFLDQIIVSGNLLNPNNSCRVLPETTSIFQATYLWVEDKAHGGKRLKKTFHGYKYEAGYSDHLPVFVDLEINPSKK